MAFDLEVADVFRRHGPEWRAAEAGHLDRMQRRVMGAIETCRTAALGGHVRRCGDCGLAEIAYNSCRNRHCPKMPGRGALGLGRGTTCRAAAGSLLPRRLHPAGGGRRDRLPEQGRRHPVPRRRRDAARHRGRPAPPRRRDRRRCRAAQLGPGDAAPPARPLHCARRRPCAGRHALDRLPAGLLPFGDGARQAVPTALPRAPRPGLRCRHAALLRRPRAAGRRQRLRRPLRHAAPGRLGGLRPERPFGGPEQVLAYLGRYTHRVAIANSRLVAMADGKVSFRWKDYRHEARNKVMTLDAGEFMRRFLLHVLPLGFHRIRHFGLLANGHRAARLARCRRLLAEQPAVDERGVDPPTPSATDPPPTCHDRDTCPCCGGALRTVAALPRAPPKSAPKRR